MLKSRIKATQAWIEARERAEAIVMEPTESESLTELDHFYEVTIEIREEIHSIECGTVNC